jgi:hypothetical protein
VRHPLSHHHVECAHPVGRDQEQQLGVDRMHVAYFAAPDLLQGKIARRIGCIAGRPSAIIGMDSTLGATKDAPLRGDQGRHQCSFVSDRGRFLPLLGLEISARALAGPRVRVHRRRLQVGVPEGRRDERDRRAVVDRMRRMGVALMPSSA